jgi:hypothetical protein
LEPAVSTDYSIPDLDQQLVKGLCASGVSGIVSAYLFGSHARGMPHRERAGPVPATGRRGERHRSGARAPPAPPRPPGGSGAVAASVRARRARARPHRDPARAETAGVPRACRADVVGSADTHRVARPCGAPRRRIRRPREGVAGARADSRPAGSARPDVVPRRIRDLVERLTRLGSHARSGDGGRAPLRPVVVPPGHRQVPARGCAKSCWRRSCCNCSRWWRRSCSRS